MVRLLRYSFGFGWFKRDEQYLLPRLREILTVEPTELKFSKMSKAFGSPLNPKDHNLLMVIS